jgi:hypothetical protein
MGNVMSQICVIAGAAAVMLGAGALGGTINCLMRRTIDVADPTKPDGTQLPVQAKSYYFLLSIAASFGVPFILSFTKSDPLSQVLDITKPDPESWFVLFAICLVVAVYAQTFMESISKKVLDMASQANVKADAAAHTATHALNVAEASTDRPENADTDPRLATAMVAARAAAPSREVDPQQQKVLTALKNEKFSLGRRSVGGIVQETKLDRDTVIQTLHKLVVEGIVEKVAGEATGTEYYQLKQPAKPAG